MNKNNKITDKNVVNGPYFKFKITISWVIILTISGVTVLYI